MMVQREEYDVDEDNNPVSLNYRYYIEQLRMFLCFIHSTEIRYFVKIL